MNEIERNITTIDVHIKIVVNEKENTKVYEQLIRTTTCIYGIYLLNRFPEYDWLWIYSKIKKINCFK
jgi:hypothetical protein